MNLRKTASKQEARMSLSTRLKLGKLVKKVGLDHLHWHLTQPIYYVKFYATLGHDWIVCPFCKRRYEDD